MSLVGHIDEDGKLVPYDSGEASGLFESVFKAVSFHNLYKFLVPDVVHGYDENLKKGFEEQVADPVGDIFSGYLGSYLSDEIVLWMVLGIGTVSITAIVVLLIRWLS